MMETPEFEIYRDALVEKFHGGAGETDRDSGGIVSAGADCAGGGDGGNAGGGAGGEERGRERGNCGDWWRRILITTRGRNTYAHAYREVEPIREPQLVVVLGTSHAPARNMFVLTKKHFATAFGQATTDVEFVERLASKLPFERV